MKRLPIIIIALLFIVLSLACNTTANMTPIPRANSNAVQATKVPASNIKEPVLTSKTKKPTSHCPPGFAESNDSVYGSQYSDSFTCVKRAADAKVEVYAGNRNLIGSTCVYVPGGDDSGVSLYITLAAAADLGVYKDGEMSGETHPNSASSFHLPIYPGEVYKGYIGDTYTEFSVSCPVMSFGGCNYSDPFCLYNEETGQYEQ